MKLRCVWPIAPVLLFLISSLLKSAAGTITIAPTPILNTVLTSNVTYEVEFSTNGTTWLASGVLVTGNGEVNSIRLDTFPEHASYRLTPVGSGAAVVPAVSTGWHLQAAFPGASELRLEASPLADEATWTHRAFVFTNLQGAFIHPLTLPLTGNEFFRAVQPAAPLQLASLTSYPVDLNSTLSGYGVVLGEMPQLYRDGYVAAVCAAVYNRDGINAAAAGECYELVGTRGQTTVMVADLALGTPAGTCDVGRPFFDLGTAAFTNLFGPGDGYGIATYRLVPAPVTGNLKMICTLNSGGYYVTFRPYNHRAGISKLELQPTANGPWIELSRDTANNFVYSSTPPLSVPFNARITSRFGEVVTFPTITSLNTDDKITANGQFAIFPDQGPSPVWMLPPVYTEGLTNIFGAQWTTTTSGGLSVTPAYSGSAYQGNYSLRIANFVGYSQLSLFNLLKFPKPPGGYLEFAIRSEGAVINGLTLRIRGSSAGGATAWSALMPLPAVNNTWRVFHIPLDLNNVPAQIDTIQLSNSTGSTLPSVNLDSIAFRW